MKTNFYTIKGCIKGINRVIMANVYGLGGSSLKEKWFKMKNHVLFSAKTARDNRELEKLQKRLKHLMKQGTMGKRNTQTYIASYQLIELINGDTNSNGQHRMGKIRANNGHLTQNFKQNYYL